MIFDSHCHAWPRWPYQPPVPDSDSRAIVEQLIWEMDKNGVDRAVIVSARIDFNPDNNEYGAEAVRRYPNRLDQLADVDCSWTDTYHTPGAAGRLEAAVEKYHPKGFTHYVRGDDDGAWFLSEEGLAFFKVAEEHNLIASLALPPSYQGALRQLAERYSSVPFLCHHMGGVRAAEEPPYTQLKEVLASAKVPNIYVKMSGFHYVSSKGWEYPYPDCGWIVRSLYEHFGPDRLCWGSDFPVVPGWATYQQALEAFRGHCPFIPDDHKARILGENLSRLLQTGRVVG